MQHSNQLINETSPYLLQHAHNPVNWFPWGEEALQAAKESNKPILISIGYSACHWCHVMERESFEDEATAALMNELFINIKIDREERPDLDHIYMDAVQAMTGSGGWPLNVFLTPDAKPFYGGTYFPPVKAFNRPSWKETLQSVSDTFRLKRNEVDAQAENLTSHLLQSNDFGIQPGVKEEIFLPEQTETIAENLIAAGDREWGGFGKAPKFPQTFSIQYLLRHHYLTGDQPSLDLALLSLDKMIDGGIYDQLGGGFARYSTDAAWLAPHFEKMLYDNALLLMVLSEAYQLTHKQRYREVIGDTIGFIEKELMAADQVPGPVAFYSALDADSEGIEGKFYVWSLQEIHEILDSDAEVFSKYYDVSEHGNWEHTNILRVLKSHETFAADNKIDVTALNEILNKARQKLLFHRAKRIRPQLDDKILLGWNALMNTACSKAFAATGEKRFKELAVSNMDFMLTKFATGKEQQFYHTWKEGKAKYPAFLDDYAYLIQALLQLQEITGDSQWLVKATNITRFVIEHFSEDSTGFFYYTTDYQKDVIVRKKELYDGAVPSGNAMMAYNLYHLSILTANKEWGDRARTMVGSLGKVIIKYPTSFGYWASLLEEMTRGTNEIVIGGKQSGKLHEEVLKEYIPNRVLMMTETGDPGFPLLEGRAAEKPSVYLCRNYTCQQPVFSAKALIMLIDSGRGDN